MIDCESSLSALEPSMSTVQSENTTLFVRLIKAECRMALMRIAVHTVYNGTSTPYSIPR
jgi:hypothetical protein